MKYFKTLTYIILLCSAFISISAWAEPTYITDRLTVDLYSLQKQKGVVIKSLPSGTPVKVLKTDGEFLMVRTSDNKTGWVPSVKVTNQKPVQIEYLQLQAKFTELNEELTASQQTPVASAELAKQKKATVKLRNNLSRSNKRIKELENSLKNQTTELDTAGKNIQLLNQQLTEAQTQANKLAEQSLAQAPTLNPVTEPPPPLSASQSLSATQNQDLAIAVKWTLIAMLITLVMGFILGKKWVDQKIRKRHGGVLIY